MAFDSTVFIFIFLPISLILYYVTPEKFKNLTFVFESLIFYAWGEPVHALVLTAAVIWSYAGALAVARNHNARRRTFALVAAGGDVLLLVVCRYAKDVLEMAGNSLAESRWFLAPIGVSFFMLQSIGYIIDVYRGGVKPKKNIVDVAVLIAMFPKVLAGPLVSCSEFEKQIAKRKFSWGRFSEGVLFFVRGMSKKVILGNGLWQVFQTIQSFPSSQMSAASAWLGSLSFALHMYFAFGGYCDMALCLGRMFGFELPENVDHPFMSVGMMDFWGRWMSTLWKWFCSYVYLPLCGGNPGGNMGFLSLLATWVLIGLWHGFSTSFVVWGIYFAVLLFLEGFVLGERLEKVPKFIRWILTLFLLMAGWALFFQTSAGEAVSYLGLMLGMGGSGFIDSKAVSIVTGYGTLWAAAFLFSVPLVRRGYEWLLQGEAKWKTVINCAAYIGLFFISLAGIIAGSGHELFYFRF